jgi:predicted nucleic acid-binding protein
MSVLLDSGFIFAFLNADDAGHDEADGLMARIAAKEFGAPFVSDHVVDELFTLIRGRTGSTELEEAAHRFLPLPSPALKGLTMVSLGPELLSPSWEVFRRFRDQRLSFTDAGLIVTMREMGIERLATLDRRLCKLVPCAV